MDPPSSDTGRVSLSQRRAFTAELHTRLQLAFDEAQAEAEAAFVEHTLRDFRRSGVDKDDATRARIQAIKEELVSLAQEFSRRLFAAGVFAMAIGFPTVPRGKARIRVMNSAAHSMQDIELAAEQAFSNLQGALPVQAAFQH